MTPSAGRRQMLYERLASMAGAGIGLREALGSLLDRSNEAERAFLAPLARAVDHGTQLAPAMRATPGLYSALEASLVAGGERSGELDAAFRALATHMERMNRLRRSVIGAAAYPVIVVHVGLVLPTFPIIVVIMKAGVLAWFTFVAVSLGLFWGVLLGAVRYHARNAGEPGHMRRLSRLPLVGAATRDAALGRFFQAFSALHGAGCAMDVTLEDAAHASGNGWLRDDLLAARERVRRGDTLTEALAGVTMVPPEDLASVATAERAGALEDATARLARMHEERLETSMQRVATLLPVALILLVAIPVAIFAIWFALGYVAEIRRLAG